MKILVIEDSLKHQKSAIETLTGHDVTIAKSYDEAIELMDFRTQWGRNPLDFDVVLTDMMMPMSEKTLVPQAFKQGEQVPYGFVLALKAAFFGAKFVAMVTDTNHHYGSMSAALDHLSHPYYHMLQSEPRMHKIFNINGAKVVFVHTPFVQEIIKGAHCNQCKGNPGMCWACKGSGIYTNKKCYVCGDTDSVGKCTTCNGTTRYDRAQSLDTKDWGRVLQDLITL